MTAASVEGLYPIGRRDIVAGWDGAAWTGTTSTDPSATAPAAWHRGFLPFLRHRWFWLVVVGSLLAAPMGLVASTTGSRWWVFAAIPGTVIAMWGGVELIWRHMSRGRDVPRTIVVWGVVAGVVASALAIAVENLLEPKVFSFSVQLWLAGPVEETAKLLVPVLLLAFGAAVFKDPRLGMLTALISGATFGAIEAWLYAFYSHGYAVFAMAAGRPINELLHIFLTGFAAAVIWLAAWRSHRVWTAAGVVAWLLAAAIHSLHDGTATLGGALPDKRALPDEATLSGGLSLLAAMLLAGLLWGVILFLLAKHSARELVPPEAVPSTPPSWRPRIARWGVPKTDRKVASPSG
jgi:RsiW-degrading membrane proteinase PrsW (M82 family)